jgi:hypothetical protein
MFLESDLLLVKNVPCPCTVQVGTESKCKQTVHGASWLVRTNAEEEIAKQFPTERE